MENKKNNKTLLNSISNLEDNGTLTIVEMAEAIDSIYKELDSNINNISNIQEIKDRMADCHDKLLYSLTKVNDTIQKLQ